MRNYRTGLLPRVVTSRSLGAGVFVRMRRRLVFGPALVAGPIRLGVRSLFCQPELPLAKPLPSIDSAGSARVAGTPLFADFFGTMGLSDFPCSCIDVVLLSDSHRGPEPSSAWPNTGPPGFRARCFRACTGSTTARDSNPPRDCGESDVAFRIQGERRRPDLSPFRGSIPDLHVPLSTLRH